MNIETDLIVVDQALACLLIVRDRIVEMPRLGLGLEQWQQRPDRQADIADKTKVELATPAQILRPDVDLRDLAVGREKLLVGKIGSQHQQHVAGVHRRVTRREANWFDMCPSYIEAQ